MAGPVMRTGFTFRGVSLWQSGATGTWSHYPFRSRNNLVEFAAIEPNAAALRAEVDLDALSLGHRKGNAANRAKHTLL